MISSRNFAIAAILAALGLPAAVSAPASAYTIKTAVILGSYTPEDAGYGARRGRDLPAVIIGNPFQVPVDVTAAAVNSGMRDGGPAPSMSGPQAAVAPLRVIWQLEGGTRTANDICDRRNPLALTTGGSASLNIVATFCRGDYAMTQVIGSADPVDDPRHPEFVNFIRQMTTNLFPPRNTDFLGDQNFPRHPHRH